MGDDKNDIKEDGQIGTLTIDKQKIKRPTRYKILLHNDDYTSMEFVIHILKNIFGKNHQEAQDIMLKVHNEGMALCGIYTFEIAESKAQEVKILAKKEEYPLLCTMEAE